MSINPGRLFGISGGFWNALALQAAAQLNLFSYLKEEPVSADSVAAQTGCDSDGVSRLLDVMAAMEIIGKTDDGYVASEESSRFLDRSSDAYIGYVFCHHHYLVEPWSKLAEKVRTGQAGSVIKKAFDDPDRLAAFQRAMYAMASTTAPVAVKEIDLSGRGSLLDLGGGPGTFAIHFCKQNPELRAVVYDLPTTKPFAEETIAKHGLSDRITFAAGDFTSEELTGRYDAVWMSHILHAEGPEMCREMIRKAVSVLAPGGMLLIHEFILNDAKDGPVFPALFSLNMLAMTERGRAYSESEIKAMLADAGLGDIQRLPFTSPTNSGIITGVKG